MDLTNVKCIGNKCKDQNVTMLGAGGQMGGRVSVFKLRCPNCGLCLMIVPMKEEYEYSISATTQEDRIQQRIEKAKIESELQLARTIINIKENG